MPSMLMTVICCGQSFVWPGGDPRRLDGKQSVQAFIRAGAPSIWQNCLNFFAFKLEEDLVEHRVLCFLTGGFQHDGTVFPQQVCCLVNEFSLKSLGNVYLLPIHNSRLHYRCNRGGYR